MHHGGPKTHFFRVTASPRPPFCPDVLCPPVYGYLGHKIPERDTGAGGGFPGAVAQAVVGEGDEGGAAAGGGDEAVPGVVFQGVAVIVGGEVAVVVVGEGGGVGGDGAGGGAGVVGGGWRVGVAGRVTVFSRKGGDERGACGASTGGPL